MWLSEDLFKQIVTSTPLVSIDLIVKNPQGQVLLGQRQNRPAQGFWFVPGGRVLKNESLDSAFKRLSQIELGMSFTRNQAQFLGVYQHFYTDSVFGCGENQPSTHYIVLAYQIENCIEFSLHSNEQHQIFQWHTIDQLLVDTAVHSYTKDYFK